MRRNKQQRQRPRLRKNNIDTNDLLIENALLFTNAPHVPGKSAFRQVQKSRTVGPKLPQTPFLGIRWSRGRDVRYSRAAISACNGLQPSVLLHLV
jgi:hypothetical protein